MATIYLAGGCFWGVEKYMASVQGVLNAEAGYANGTTASPTYGDVSSGRSGYTETVRVDYDPAVAPLPFLLELFYKAIDPTSVNRQGNDVGTQYRSGIYYSDPADRAVIERSLAQLQKQYDRPIAVEAEALTSYTPAEEYHQDYLDKTPGGYCHIEPRPVRRGGRRGAGSVPVLDADRRSALAPSTPANPLSARGEGPPPLHTTNHATFFSGSRSRAPMM